VRRLHEPREAHAAATLGPIAEQRIDRVAEWGQLPAGAGVSKGAVLFPRLEEEPA
jgi:methionyl-tRNA synthetase